MLDKIDIKIKNIEKKIKENQVSIKDLDMIFNFKAKPL